MHVSNRFVVLLVIVTGLFLPAAAGAQEPHSWCIPGLPMLPNNSIDPTTNKVIGAVCGNSATASCCGPGGRWSLSCVQAGAVFARQNNLGGGDFCGRYAWAQGPVGNQQFYPRDFNLFVTAGGVSGLRDVDGAVAASGSVSANSFNLNVRPREGLALLAGGGVSLANGSVNGGVVYAGGFGASGVTFFNGARPTAPTNPFPINFQDASSRLIAMSQAISHYDSALAVKTNSTITFTGSDPELNVFFVTTDMLTGTTSYVYSTPASSTVIVNVRGATANIANAGFSGNALPQHTLWNFVDATSLSLQSVGFPGSILAPKAAADLRNGQIVGTVVVASGQPTNVELYSAPFQIPSCGGGLCIDPTWSASADTVIDDDGTVGLLEPEAGFLEIDGGNYVGNSTQRQSPTHRIWYAFQPAAGAAKTKPLAVFFNGGPGASTSSLMFAFNTATMTVDPQRTPAGASIMTNPTPWTQFANLLYIDAPATGFSYPLANADGSQPSVGTDMDRDAGVFTRVVLRFLKRHPGLLNNRVVIVGESYGGERATLMLQHLYNDAQLTNSLSDYQDGQLANEQEAYFSAVFNTLNPSLAQLASKFGHQALIEPVIAGHEQVVDFSKGSKDAFPLSNCRSPTCMTLNMTDPLACDVDNCDQPFGWSDGLESTAVSRLMNVATLATMLGVNPRTIEWMKASSRTRAYGRNDGTLVQSPTDMINTFGTLAIDDSYFVLQNETVLDGYPGAVQWNAPGAGLTSATDYVNQIKNGVSTFVTTADFDANVHSPAIPYAIAFFRQNNATFGSLVSGVSYEKTDVTGLARPGDSFITYADGTQKQVYMPFSYASGHTIVMRQPAQLLADVSQWYQQTPH